MLKKLFVLIILALIVFAGFKYLSKFSFKSPTAISPVIITGEGNPGRISLYKKSSEGRFTKQSIDTGFRYVWTVRIGDGRGDGHKRIYAGVGNSFFASTHGCEVLEFDPSDNFKKEVVDNVGDVRCKDLTIGDLDNNGGKVLVLGTHGRGLVIAYRWNNLANSGRGAWDKEVIEDNYLAKYDEENKTNHKVAKENLPFDTVVQTAAHIVRIGDADNDGKNELIATISDPLENPNKDHKLFLKIYKKDGNSWKSSIIDTLESPIPFKATIDIVDLEGSGKNDVVVGASHHQLLVYRLKNGKWEKQVIDQEEGGKEDNMKGVSIGSLTNEKTKSIIVATGVPQAAVYEYRLDDGKVTKRQLVNISALLAPYRIFEGIGENSLDSKILELDGKKAIVVAGEQDSSFSGASNPNISKFGWEATTLGFTALLTPSEAGKYLTQFLDFRSSIALDVGKLE